MQLYLQAEKIASLLSLKTGILICGFFMRHCVMTSRDGVLDKVVIDLSAQSNIIDQVMWWKSGDRIENHLTAKFGIIFLKCNTMEEMLEKTEKMPDLIQVRIQV